MPSNSYLKSLTGPRDATIRSILAEREVFCQLFLPHITQARFKKTVKKKGMSLKRVLELSSRFHFLRGTPKPWSTEGHFTCSCVRFFKRIACEHCLALAVFLKIVDIPAPMDIRHISDLPRRGRPITEVIVSQNVLKFHCCTATSEFVWFGRWDSRLRKTRSLAGRRTAWWLWHLSASCQQRQPHLNSLMMLLIMSPSLLMAQVTFFP